MAYGGNSSTNFSVINFVKGFAYAIASKVEITNNMTLDMIHRMYFFCAHLERNKPNGNIANTDAISQLKSGCRSAPNNSGSSQNPLMKINSNKMFPV